MLVVLLMAVVVLWVQEGFISPDGGEALCDDPVYGQIEGDINRPGVYAFCGRITLDDLIERGGGFEGEDYPHPMPDDTCLESGAKVTINNDHDEWNIHVEGISAFYKVTLGIPISVNTESEEGLTAIPGIGPSMAGAIIKERDRRGGFKGLGELKDVYGIGDRLYERILPYVEL